MLVTKTFHDIQTQLDSGGRALRIFVISPSISKYPQAKFPGKLNSLDYRSSSMSPMLWSLSFSTWSNLFADWHFEHCHSRCRRLQVICFPSAYGTTYSLPAIVDIWHWHSEIYQVTGPVERFASQIASQGFVVGSYPWMSLSILMAEFSHATMQQLVLRFTMNSKVRRRSPTM